MRLPWTKLYRAFPELDEFSDRQCEAWLARFWKTRPGTMWFAVILPGVLGVVSGFILFRVGSFVFFPLARSLGGSITLSRSVLQFLAVSAWVFLSAGPALIGALLTRDVILRRLVRAQLGSIRCLRCDYSLLGLPVRDGQVTCSECGDTVMLADRNLTPEDLIPKSLAGIDRDPRGQNSPEPPTSESEVSPGASSAPGSRSTPGSGSP